MVPGVFWNKLSFESLLGCCGLLVGCLLKLTVKLYAAPQAQHYLNIQSDLTLF